MTLKAQLVEGLPRLAWCAEMRKSSAEVRLIHGPWVEVDETCFVEGVWNGDFAERGFLEAECFFGTGGRVGPKGVLFGGSSDPLLKLYCIRRENALFVSNSIALALVTAGERPDVKHIGYQTDFQRFVACMANHVGTVPLHGGNEMVVAHFRNLHVTLDLKMHFEIKAVPKGWRTFRGYEQFLLDSLRGMAANGSDRQRCRTFRLLGQLSSGYDSSACTALARDAGCEEAISFRTPRVEKSRDSSLSDDGEAVARLLGLRIKTYETLGYKDRPDMPEVEFMACGELGQEVYLSSAEAALPATILIAGHHGDHVWDRCPANTRTDLPRKSSSGCSLNEFRLRVGFVHVPLPMLGAVRHPDLFRITRSPEMAPWTLGTTYDRPIARRFVEERGVPRGSFAVEKKAASVLLNSPLRIVDQLSPGAASSFLAYHRQIKHQRNHGKQAVYELLYLTFGVYRRLLRTIPVHRLLQLIRLPPDLLCPIPKKFREDPGMPSFLVHWGLEHLSDRYSSALQKQGENSVPATLGASSD